MNDYDALISAVAAMPMPDRLQAKWLVGKDVAGDLARIRDTLGRHVYEPGIQNEPARLLGFPVQEVSGSSVRLVRG